MGYYCWFIFIEIAFHSRWIINKNLANGTYGRLLAPWVHFTNRLSKPTFGLAHGYWIISVTHPYYTSTSLKLWYGWLIKPYVKPPKWLLIHALISVSERKTPVVFVTGCALVYQWGTGSGGGLLSRCLFQQLRGISAVREPRPNKY